VLINGLREIEVDGEIFDGFMYAAHSNTIREIETCGILCGKLKRDESGFTVTHLIIPKQTGTTDTCATTNEDEIFEYQMKHDLLTLGWIHVREEAVLNETDCLIFGMFADSSNASMFLE